MKNIFNKPLKSCSFNPLTGFYRSGYCAYYSDDVGLHNVCAIVTKEFLNFTKSKGNDLTSVVKEGDKWCLCIGRWMEAYKAGVAPKIDPFATSIEMLKYVSYQELEPYFIEVP